MKKSIFTKTELTEENKRTLRMFKKREDEIMAELKRISELPLEDYSAREEDGASDELWLIHTMKEEYVKHLERVGISEWTITRYYTTIA